MNLSVDLLGARFICSPYLAIKSALASLEPIICSYLPSARSIRGNISSDVQDVWIERGETEKIPNVTSKFISNVKMRLLNMTWLNLKFNV